MYKYVGVNSGAAGVSAIVLRNRCSVPQRRRRRRRRNWHGMAGLSLKRRQQRRCYKRRLASYPCPCHLSALTDHTAGQLVTCSSIMPCSSLETVKRRGKPWPFQITLSRRTIDFSVKARQSDAKARSTRLEIRRVLFPDTVCLATDLIRYT